MAVSSEARADGVRTVPIEVRAIATKRTGGCDAKSRGRAVCDGCPAERRGVLEGELPPARGACAFQHVSVRARQPLPSDWSASFAGALVHSGVLVRERVSGHGHACATDIAGPGCYVSLRDASQRAGQRWTWGYAATDLQACLLTPAALRRISASGGAAAYDLVALLSSALERTEALAEARAQGSAAEQVRTLLDVLSRTLAPPLLQERLPERLWHLDLAHVLGMRRETFCRALRKLADEGTAPTRGRRALRTV